MIKSAKTQIGGGLPWLGLVGSEESRFMAAGLAGWLWLAVSGGPTGAPYDPEPTPVWRPNWSELDPRTEHVFRRQIVAYVRYYLQVLTQYRRELRPLWRDHIGLSWLAGE